MKIKEDVEPICTSEFWYDVIEGGYIAPEHLLEAEDAKKVRAAIDTLEDFRDALEDNGLIEEM